MARRRSNRSRHSRAHCSARTAPCERRNAGRCRWTVRPADRCQLVRLRDRHVRAARSVGAQLRETCSTRWPQPGFNTIRLPYSNQLFDPSSTPQGIDYQKNPDLQGLNGLADHGSDRRRGRASAACASSSTSTGPTPTRQSELWYTDALPESRWIADWVDARPALPRQPDRHRRGPAQRAARARHLGRRQPADRLAARRRAGRATPSWPPIRTG